ncbi:MAG TPA: hypothetical protein VM513_15190 [Kofleriaceae bacterium]|jgi:hypothetical protein|nr:hypothetical protein [Kofleriaceae bacterium]
MKHLVALAVLALAGCPSKEIPLYQSLPNPSAKGCTGAMPRYDYRSRAATLDAAVQQGHAEIRKTVAKDKGCGAYIFQESKGQSVSNDGLWDVVYQFQTCACNT